MWNDKSLINLLYFPNIFMALTEHTNFIWKHSDVIVETFKSKSILWFKALSCTTLSPGLGACICAWQLFSSLHLCLAPFLGSMIVLQLHNWSSKFGKSTVLVSAKQFGRICFFCFYLALSIFSPRVRLKERVVTLYWGISICPEVVRRHLIVSYHKRVFPEWKEVQVVERDIEVQGKVQMKMIIPK